MQFSGLPTRLSQEDSSHCGVQGAFHSHVFQEQEKGRFPLKSLAYVHLLLCFVMRGWQAAFSPPGGCSF